MENLVLVGVGIIALVIVILLIKYLFVGAFFLFSWAAEQGFIGVAAYFACWIFLFPFMLTASVITGAVISWSS
jgi:uncharacterized membrane protein